MPIHPALERILAAMPAAGDGAPPTLAQMRAGADWQDLHSGRRREVAATEDRRIPGPGGELPVRIYTPEGKGPFPLFLFIHGGGFVLGSIESHDSVCRSLAHASGSKVISVEYRLAPEHPFPAATEDCYAAAEWVYAHAGELDGMSGRIAIGGDSAGGNLAAAVCLMRKERGRPPLAKQLLLYPVTDFRSSEAAVYPSRAENGEGKMLTSGIMEMFRQSYLPAAGDAAHPHASLMGAGDLSGLPPAMVITAEYDPLRDEGEQYAARLREAGVPAETVRCDGMIHGFFNLLDEEQLKEIYRPAAAFLTELQVN
ncbi:MULTISPECIES: alpha/beta hydrolase [Paenibacillus]|uniref:alpha/beta hydrolase n=1 Tax=Paenibacillus TaxID=44249 RepID=UPI0022B919A0|nr:alpha/beta hydrolase [Paenibacillus caseinilyticus]MCZ8521248.1 alpha/beta hydrolase [Paenibacillus caseinilyticus]